MSADGERCGHSETDPFELGQMLQLMKVAAQLPKGVTLAQIVMFFRQIEAICGPEEINAMAALIDQLTHKNEVEPVRWGNHGIGD